MAALICTGCIARCDRPLRMMACGHVSGEEWGRLIHVCNGHRSDLG